MKFVYRAKSHTGEEITGEKEAVDKFALARELRAEGAILLTAKDANMAQKKKWWQMSFGGRVKLKDKIVFASNLGAMINAGLSLSRALNVIERQTANKHFQSVIRQILESINKGESLSKALSSQEKVFPPLFIAMVGAGEESGKLTEALQTVGDQMSKTYELKRKIRGGNDLSGDHFNCGGLYGCWNVDLFSANFNQDFSRPWCGVASFH